uniref:Uncharacterized protein n=1 Tax=Arundo donax TaxID=35708 RepID=A0A0A8XN06_ARUDO
MAEYPSLFHNELDGGCPSLEPLSYLSGTPVLVSMCHTRRQPPCKGEIQEK